MLTFDEITIINSIASLQAERGKYKEAIGLGYWLKEYVEEKVFDNNERKKKYPLIVYNLSNWLGLKRRYEEAYEVSQNGIDFCIKNGALYYFPYLLFNKACGLAEMGRIMESKKYFNQAAVLFESVGNEEKSNKTATWCKEKYDIEITS